jgi:redox-sensitive bicupin YhaK (pirin superfamily)
MLKKILKDDMHVSNLGWLESRFHFSFADYYNPKNMHFGVLRVLNDDIIHPSSGFGMHQHKDMEIISYIVEGEITHKDSMGNERTLKRGEVQYMSAGIGVYHSEYNNSPKKDLRLLQIWIIPPQKELEPIYGEELYTSSERENKLLNIVSGTDVNARVKINQEVNIYVCELDAEKSIEYILTKEKQIYFVQIEGHSSINSLTMSPSDAMEIVNENALNITAISKSHFLFIEMRAS